MAERQLVFRDEQGHEKSFTMGDGDHLKFSSAFDEFLETHLSEENTTFRLERVLTDEVLTLETSVSIIGRVRNGSNPESGYRRYTRRADGSELCLRFAYSGYEALDGHGPWTTARENLLPWEPGENLELAWVEDLRRDRQRRREIAAMPKLDSKALETFCMTWADTGHNEYVGDSEEYYVLFDGGTVDNDKAAWNELMDAIATLGLRQVEAPAGSLSGEVWVRSDPRIDIELENWA